MYRFLLSPRWLALWTVLALAVAAFVVLGWWQLGRFEGRSGSDRAAEAVPLADVLRPGEPVGPDDGETLVTVTGRWDPAGQVVLPERSLENRSGAFVATPLDTATGTLVVNRGWVEDLADADPAALPVGEVAVTGLLRPWEGVVETGVPAGTALPAGQVRYLAPDQLATRPAYDGYLALDADDPAADPAPRPLVLGSGAERGWTGLGAGQNLGYALQWFVFAAAAVFFLVRVARLEAQDRRTARAEGLAGAHSGAARLD